MTMRKGRTEPGPATFEAIRKVASEVALARGKQEVLEALVEQACALLGGDGGGFYIADPVRREVRCVVSVGTPAAVLGTVLRYGEGAAGQVAETGQPLNIKDYRRWPGRSPQFESLAPFRALVSVPTHWDDRVTGILHVLRTHSDVPFTRDDVELLTVLGQQAGVTLENARLLEAADRRVHQVSLLNDLTRAALGAGDRASLAHVLVDRTREIFGADACYLSLWEEGRGGSLVAVSGPAGEPSLPPEGLPAQAILTESALRFGRPVTMRSLLEMSALPPDIAVAGPPPPILAVPLIIGERWMGALLVARRQEHDFRDEELALADQVSGQVALALARLEAYESERRHRDELEGLRRAGLRLASTLELAPMLQALLVEALNLVEAYDAHIFLYDGTRLTFGAALWEGEFRSAPYAEPREDGLTMRVARSGKAIVINDTARHELYANDAWEGSLAGLPVRAGGEVRGVMTVAFRSTHAITEDRQRMLQLFADQAGVAIENARLFAAVDTERKRVRLLYEVGNVISGSLDAEEILRRAIRLATRHLGGSRGAAFRLEEESGRLRLVAVDPSPTMSIEQQDREFDLRLGKGLSGWVAQHRQPVLVPDILQDDRWVPVPGNQGLGGSAIAVPVTSADDVLGVFIVVAESGLEPSHLELLQAIAGQVGLALVNAQRYQQVTRRLAERTALQQVAQVVNRRLELTPLLEEVVRQVGGVLGYPVVEIFLVEDGELILRMANGSEGVGEKRQPLEAGVIGRALRTRQPSYVSDVRLDPDYIIGVPSTLSEIAVPLYSGEIVVGVLNVESPEAGGLTLEDMNLLSLLGDQVSVALENAALYERLRQHTEELQQTVADRTAELQRALDQAQQADQLKTRFVADVSHELRTPLTNIRLYLDLLEKGRSEKFADYLETLHRETGRLIDLIEDLLTVSRLDAGTAEMDPTWIDLNTMAHGLVEDRRRLVGRMDLAIRLESQSDLPLVRADERMISQVVANLLTNAVNYTLPGGSIAVRTDTIGDGESKWARLAVADTGLGIPEHEIPRLFERFFRGAASRARGVSGTGLGLAICKEILDRHEGRITATSRVGEGSCFTIWLPVQRATEIGTVRPGTS